MPYLQDGSWEEPTERVDSSLLENPLRMAGPRRFPYGLGSIPQIAFAEDEAIVDVD